MIKEFVQENKYWFETAGILLIFVVWISKGQIITACGTSGFIVVVGIALVAHYFAVRSRLITLRATHPELFVAIDARKQKKTEKEN